MYSVMKNRFRTTTYRPQFYRPPVKKDDAVDAGEDSVEQRIDDLKSKLPWLASILNANHTISLSTGELNPVHNQDIL